MNPDSPDSLVLKHRLHLSTPAQARRIKQISILILVALGVLMVALAMKFNASGYDWSDLPAKLGKKISDSPWDGGVRLLMLVVLVFHAVFLMFFQSHEKLILSPSGIEYRSPLPRWLQGFRPGWSLRWEQVRSANLEKSKYASGPQSILLVLDARNQVRKLAPFMWVDPDNFEPMSAWQLSRLRNPGVENSEIVKYLDAHVPGLKLGRDVPTGGGVFALEEHAQTRIVLVAFSVFALYALIDGLFVNEEIYIDPPLYSIYAAGGAVAAIATLLWLRRGKAPWTESIGLALFLGIAIAAAQYPAALRLNAMTDPDGTKSVKYEMVSIGIYRSEQPGYPKLSFDDYLDYWTQFKPGSNYTFSLHKGVLDLWQLDMGPVHGAMRKYYRKKNKTST